MLLLGVECLKVLLQYYEESHLNTPIARIANDISSLSGLQIEVM